MAEHHSEQPPAHATFAADNLPGAPGLRWTHVGSAVPAGGTPPTRVRPAPTKVDWAGGAFALFLLFAWIMGAFDVFLSRQGLGFAATHQCYHNILGTVWCDGPWSTNPVPDDAIATPEGFTRP